MSLQSLVDNAVVFAKGMIQKSPTHQLLPVALCFGPDGNKVIPGLFEDNEQKQAFYREVGMICRAGNLQIALLINDAAMREVKTEKDMDFIKENYDTESPLSYPESLRTECIMVSAHNFATGETCTATQPYRNMPDGSVDFHRELMRLPEAKSALVDYIMEGWTA